ncbi:cation-transporting atpase 13a3, partial [Nannochloropsis oceanica]
DLQPHLFPASSGSSFHLSDAQGNDTDLLVHTRPIPIAMVLHTGFTTARGQLVRAILFPPPPKFDFEAQGYKFIWVLASTLVVGAILQIVIYIRNDESAYTIFRDLMNLVTIAIPPALPLSLSIGLQVRREGGREGG